MSRILGSIMGKEGTCDVWEDDDGRVYFNADGKIDADGANGQSGAPPAYKEDDTGSDFLANGGMARVNGKVICKKEWARDVVILGSDNEPRVFPGGVIASMTWYRSPGKRADDPFAYVDAETVPYVVVPPLIVQATAGVVRGCKARITFNGRSVDCVVADKSGFTSIGEMSIAAARALHINASPRSGGVSSTDVFFELWPGIAAPGYMLQPS
ncbi:glycoside hydrolase family 75 protein [Janthinobacterium sp. SUN100]|uniref:glycoside hydrolase family 75 protein n=1 Tax=Janthinobacterium sp. SUN100 TaxID=3004101 RepID=UPI0025AFAF87|nr:glycoside hydrolase family 75 protein [Janthinobacterium sp. SUN100]MDN2702048.1 glycoside hydrolase family 75 protein [Janthinobacterium sp. SUN100]